MASAIPKFVDLLRAPLGRSRYAGQLDTARLPRLAESGVVIVDAISADMTVTVREHQPALASGHLTGSVEVACQRCLAPMTVSIDVEFAWEAVTADRDEPVTDAEPMLVSDDRLEVIAGIEDELLLAVPDYPRHDYDCEPPERAAQTD